MERNNLTKENITKEDVIEMYKRNILSAMDSRLSSDDAFYDTFETFDEISKLLNFTHNEDGVITVPPELKWIEEVLDQPLDDYPVLIWKSDIEKEKGATLEKFFNI